MAAIYFLASSANSKVSALQSALNTVMKVYGYTPLLTVSGILDGKTCGALAVIGTRYLTELTEKVDVAIVQEAAHICSLASKNGAKLTAPVGPTITPAPTPTPMPPADTPILVAPAPAPSTPAETPVLVAPTPAPVPVQEPAAPAPVVPSAETPTTVATSATAEQLRQKCESSGGIVDGSQCVWPDDSWCDTQDFYNGSCVKLYVEGDTGKPKKSGMWPWIIGGGVLAVGAGVYVAMKHKKK